MATTAIETEPTTETGDRVDFRPYRLSSEQYWRMVETGVLSEDTPVFLWKGQLVEKMPKGRPHSIALSILYRLAVTLIPVGWYAQQEQPIHLEEGSEPEPDLTVIRGAYTDDPKRPPGASAVVLAVEVSDSSVSVDSRAKLQAYASESIPYYWIVNIPMRRIDVYSRPTGATESPTYAECASYSREELVPMILDGNEVARIAVNDLFPWA